MPTETIGSFLTGFLHVSDTLPPDRPALFSPAPVVQSTRLLRNLLSRVQQPFRAEIISKAIAASEAFALPAFIVSADEKNPNEPAPDRQPILCEEDLKKLKALVVEKIKKAANENRLQTSEHFMWLLQCWRVW